MRPTRRQFIQEAGGALAAAGAAAAAWGQESKSSGAPMDARTFLAGCLYSRQEVDDWFDGRAFPFAQHDPELGWLLRDGRVADGVDGATSTYVYSKGKYHERLMSAYADQPCRINTYGNSFTQCHQVSDNESWQEVLAGHLCEPVRNFGIGGWSVYQAYLRMLREESRAPAQLIVLNIFDDDHCRNLDAWRNLRVPKHVKFIEPTLPYLQVNLGTGECRQMRNPCPTRDSYYHLCDLDWCVERFRDDFVLKILLAHANASKGNPRLAYKTLQELSKTHGIETNLDTSTKASAAADKLHTRAALQSTMKIVEWVEEFARRNGKKVLYVLSFRAATIAQWIKENRRFDQPFVDFLQARKLPYVDLLEAHAADYAKFKISVEDYLRRFFIGHYNPLGNFFTAFAIKNKVVEMLDPKPASYRVP